ncbi:MAG: DUF2252 domain-containing protein [Alphaproteobacteria bacterium]|nr:DUF2252 domain-containing protein [Alphaproteobacteria bacterium]MBU1516004.1 DUF2252 domain-containing protein [Alphaproteobacteria bacterium]MBU2092781.1 DUF2252 domain-containing protein [Alphaproteobacteria bacterium]MBU2153694.1 DUF2252 domain-containing protein [Alphaproteobacteria bacterium]MBU2308322.1 DUF2252 domain-containing protein [Alphaproteobacteria bacterium]
MTISPRAANDVGTSREERAARLTATRNLKMARSAHAYVRGSTAKFYAWLEEGAGKTPEGPPVWICGDCHVGNLGPLADAKGRVAVQIRDLDQTVIGNPAHDLIRLGLSLASAARGSDLPGVTTARILENLAAGYEAALAGKFDKPRDKSNRPRVIQGLLEHAVRRRWRHLAQERLDTVKPMVPLGRKFWPLSPDEQADLRALFQEKALHEMIGGLQGRDDHPPVEMVDAAYWIKGCSSLGRLRYAAMLRVGEGARSTLCLVDIKEAVRAAAPRAPDLTMPRDNAVRVVTGARALSPHLGERMIAARLQDTAVVMRELMPQDLKIEVERLSRQEATTLAYYLAGVVGRAHGRQMDAATRDAWRTDLNRARTATLDAPSWLWSSVVELISVHEAAYLEHCRRYALSVAA